MRITANDIINAKIVDALISGAVPEGWESTELVVNFADASEVQRGVIMQGIEMARAARAAGKSTKAESPEAYVFKMKSTWPLSSSLQEAGWEQWHCSVQVISKDKCKRRGVKYKKHRYPVHLWISPEGKIALAKIKLEGKAPLE